MRFIRKHKGLILFSVILVFTWILISPYFLAFLNDCLNSHFPAHNIKLGDYINYISSTITGVSAVAISILALLISYKSEKREQNTLHISINTSKKALKEYIANCCKDFYDISKSQKSIQDIELNQNIEQHIEILKVNKIINEDDFEMCMQMHSFVKGRGQVP